MADQARKPDSGDRARRGILSAARTALKTGHTELQVHFNAPPAGRPARRVVDDGRDLIGRGAEVIAFEGCLSNMRVIDALLRSGQFRRVEQP